MYLTTERHPNRPASQSLLPRRDDHNIPRTRDDSQTHVNALDNARPGRDPTKFPTCQLTLLALVRLAEPIALTSIFPYAWKLTLHLHIGEKEDASFYAGLLIAAFALAESVTGMFWGGLSDRVGRKPILLSGCAGTVLSLLVVGFSSNFWMALSGRALGGLLNGNIGVIQTMVGELVTLPEHEARAFAIMPFVWSVGTILGPAIGGCLADPSGNFPSVFSRHGIFGQYPYLLPNLVCAFLLVLAILAGSLAIEETHPDKQSWSKPVANRRQSVAETPILQTSGSTEHPPADLSRESYGTFNSVDVAEDRYDGLRSMRVPPQARTIYTRRVVMLVAALGIFTYHSMTWDNLFPIFMQDERQGHGVSAMSTSEVLAGGLGLTTQQVGLIMCVNGVIALFVQGVIFPFAASWLGIWKLFIVTTMGHPIAYLLVPSLAFLPTNALYPGIYTALTIRNTFSILAYPVLLILIKEASPGRSYLGRINGLAASAGAGCRTMASPIAGYLYSVGMKVGFTPLAWWASAFVATIGVGQLLFMTRTEDKRRVRDLRHFTRQERKSCDGAETVQVSVQRLGKNSSDEEAQ